MNLKGKIAVVTGGGSGIGRAMAERFHAEDAEAVVIADIDDASAEEAAKSVRGISFRCDVGNEADIGRLVRDVESRYGVIDLFCSNAGIVHFHQNGNLTGSNPDNEWNRGWQTNVMAHIYAARACLPGMIARRSGWFLNTISAAGLLSHIGNPIYSVTKHAAIGFAESLAISHRDDGIGVSILCPQAVRTKMLGNQAGAHSKDGVLTPEQVAESVVQGLSEQRFLILPHPQVGEYFKNKADNYDRWLSGMVRLRRNMTRIGSSI